MSDHQRSWDNLGARRPMRAASARAAAPGFRLGGMSDMTRRILIIAVGLTGSVLLAATIIWGMSRMGPRSVPVIEADGRPFRVRPEGLPVTPPASQQPRVMPAPEAPRIDALRQQMQPPAVAPVPTPAPAATAPVAAPVPPPVTPQGRGATPRQAGASPAAVAPAGGPTSVARQPAPSAPAAAPATASAAVRPSPPAGRSAVQLSAAATEEAARAEWERLRRRAPELAGMTPRITKLDREGREPLWRLRVSGLADPAAARALCEQLRARGAACNPV